MKITKIEQVKAITGVMSEGEKYRVVFQEPGKTFAYKLVGSYHDQVDDILYLKLFKPVRRLKRVPFAWITEIEPALPEEEYSEGRA